MVMSLANSGKPGNMSNSVSSKLSSPRSTRIMTLMAVNCLVTDARRKLLALITGAPSSSRACP